MISLSVIIPTCGRPSLRRMLESLKPQLSADDEIIVVGDGPIPSASNLAAEFRCRYQETSPTRCYGNAQRDAGIAMATKSHLWFCDDDDVVMPEGISAIKCAVAVTPNLLHGFTFLSGEGRVNGPLQQRKVGTPSIVWPRRPDLPRWQDHSADEASYSDWIWISKTAKLFPDVMWHPEVVYKASPRAYGSLPPGVTKGHAWLPNLSRLEIQVNFQCDRGCYNCCAMTGVAPGRPEENLQPEQLSRMFSNCDSAGHVWKLLTVVGGEPSQHPEFAAIMNIIAEYHDAHPDVKVRFFSHGATDRARAWVKLIGRACPWIELNVHGRTSRRVPFFWAVNVAPQDMDPEWAKNHHWEGCRTVADCGVSFSYSGFYCCPTATMIDRVFAFDCGIRSVGQLTHESLTGQYAALCRLCGSYRRVQVDDGCNILSPTWREQMKQWPQRILSRY